MDNDEPILKIRANSPFVDPDSGLKLNFKSFANDNAQKYINQVKTMGKPNMLNPKETIIDNAVVVELEPFGEKVLIKFMRALEQRQGHGSRVLKMLCDLADQSKITLLGYARNMPDGPNINKLLELYRRFGFRETNTIDHAIERLPK